MFYKNQIALTIIFIVLLCAVNTRIFAQPSNDNCDNASVITIPSGGFGLGVFNSAQADISKATIQSGEYFDLTIFQAGEDQKSVWYKFSLPTTRSVRVTLQQPGNAIPAGEVGFAVYKTGSCLPGKDSLSTKFTPIARFSSSYHPCVDAGDYLVQVSSKAGANGQVYIQLEVYDSTDAQYDHPADAYDFGVLMNNQTPTIGFSVECQSIEDASETCPGLADYKQYTKSTWHTFTTPAYFDFIAIMAYYANCAYGDSKVFGYALYKGDVKIASYKTLPKINACDSFYLPGYYPAYRLYRCSDLEPNTTYSIQLLYKSDFKQAVQLSIGTAGTTFTQAPEPVLSKLPASNKLGKLDGNNGQYTYGTDYLGCNSRHSLHPCAPSLPAAGIPYNGTNYNLSTFFTFELTTSANISLSVSNSYCGYPTLLRLYNQNLTNSCTGLDTGNIILQGISGLNGSCLPAGIYTLQVSGTDTLQPGYFNCGSSINCQLSNLGSSLNLAIYVKYVNALNTFSLKTAGAYDAINTSGSVMQPLLDGTTYQFAADTFGCSNTVMPPKPSGDYCNPDASKASYHEFVIGDANGDSKADSGVVTIYGFYGANRTYYNTVVYKGDANALATAQNAHLPGDSIKNLSAITQCLTYSYCYGYENFCITPGTYTATILGDDNHVGLSTQPALTFNVVKTAHYNGATAQNMGSILDTLNGAGGTVYSDKDYFSCTDNAVTINGVAPPDIYGKPATKAIYRQFYLSSAAIVDICKVYNYNDCFDYDGPAILFSGKASDGLNNLNLVNSTGALSSCMSTGACNVLAPGWYTIVCYGSGPTYAKPFQNINEAGGYGSAIGHYIQLSITVTIACPPPQFNRPKKAAIDTITKQPFLLEWKLRSGSTPAYPKMDTTYTLYTENFNCTVDTPFIFVKPCDANINRVVYYVFKIPKESYLQIDTKNLWGQVFAGDVRVDSAKFKTAKPIQPCMQAQGYIQLCRLQAGTYTLVMFASNANVSNGCGSVTPQIYITNVGYARFDRANNAYDFGTIPGDSLYYNGKPGDRNPLDAGRAASNDFFYCTTGATETDPADAVCGTEYNPYIYNTNVNNHLYDSAFPATYWNMPRRNLWYSFVVDKPGNVHVKVTNPSSSSYHYTFAVYKSDVDGNLPFSTVVSSGQVDSTTEQGLNLIDYNGRYGYYYCWTAPEEITFYRDPCSAQAAERYYILVEDFNSWPYDIPGAKPNSQVEVSIMLDTVSAIATKFDHYYQAFDMGSVGPGRYKAAEDNFTCATADETDPTYAYNYCAKKTLWYKFTPTVTGHVKYRMYIDSAWQHFGINNIQLFREDIAGDSTKNGLIYQSPGYFTDYTDGSTWGENCIAPGTYYLLITGCNQLNEYTFPEIEIDEDAGDFCSAPVVAVINGAGADRASAIIDCHTIGTDYGEFAPQLSCPVGANTENYKSTWFRLDVKGSDTLDVTVYIEEHVNAEPGEIQYRKMSGDCSAMQEESCVQDSRTKNTYRCLLPGKSYFIQVFTPVVNAVGQYTNGNVDLVASSVVHTDTCAPDPNCLAVAKFIPQFDCATDDSVRFVNYSTYGSNIQYNWSFGYNGKTSTSVSPSFFYPALATDKVYNVKLKVNNAGCNGKDSVTVPVTIPARPYVDLGADITSCNYDTAITLHATSFPGATYYWQDGSTDSIYNVPYKEKNQYYVEVSYNNCISRDTVDIYVNPIQKLETQSQLVCPGDSVQLTVDYGYYYNYNWNTGATGYYTFAKNAGTYWVDIAYNGCIVRDSFEIKGISNVHPLNNDTSICFSSGATYQLDATTEGAYYYEWQDGAAGAQYTVSEPGTYWVNMYFDYCTVRDSVIIQAATPPDPKISGRLQFCTGDSTTLDAGAGYNSYLWSTGDTTKTITVKKAGNYSVNVSNYSGCPATSPTVTVAENALPLPKITGPSVLCNADSVSLSVADTYVTYLWSTGATVQNVVVRQPGKVSVRVTDNNGCMGSDSITVRAGNAAQTDSLQASICQGSSYVMPSGVKVSTAGFHTDTLRSAAGCDSLITTVNLSIQKAVTASITASICEGSSYILPSGKKLSVAGSYKDTLRSSLGCDSLITSLVLNVNSAIRTNITASVCLGDFYTLPSGRMVNTASTYQDTLRGVSGCDSLITSLTLTVVTPVTASLSAAVCAGQAYTMPSGAKASVTGIYNDTIRTTKGCDSLITTVDLKVSGPVVQSSISATICEGASYILPSGKRVTQAGTYKDSLKNTTGCDSLITTLALTVKTPARSAVNASICNGSFYTLPSGRLVNTANTYQDTVKGTSGCDSLITSVVLSVVKPVASSLTASVCAGQVYTLPSGKKASVTGIYVDTVRTIAGCDSLITTLTLFVGVPVTASNVAVSICLGQTYALPSGRRVNIAGSYKDTLRTKAGCDSIITNLTLTVISASIQNSADAFCEGGSYTLPWGRVVFAAGTYSDTIHSLQGCDSIISNVALLALTPVRRSSSAGICAGQTYKLPSGKMVSTAGIYSDTLRGSRGCDSIINTITLSVAGAPVTRNVAATICQGGFYTMPSGKKVSAAGTSLDTLRNRNGCDSIFTVLQLSLQPKPVVTLQPPSADICVGDSVQLFASGGDSYSWSPATGLSAVNRDVVWAYPRNTTRYKAVITSGVCKDSLYSDVTIHPAPNLVVAKSNDINCMYSEARLSASGGSTYIWSPADSTLFNPFSSSPIVIPKITTMYHVVATTDFGCTAEASIEVKVMPGDNNGYVLPSAFTPNGDGLNDCFGVQSWGMVTDLRFSIYDRTGVLLFSTTDPSKCWGGYWHGQLMQSGTYVYQASANSACGPIYRKGTVVLIR